MSWFKPIYMRFTEVYMVGQYYIAKPSVSPGYYQNLQVNSIFNCHCWKVWGGVTESCCTGKTDRFPV